MEKKIPEFTKEELSVYMKASREIYRFDAKAATWKRAFELYRGAVDKWAAMDCSGCISKVKAWLEI